MKRVAFTMRLKPGGLAEYRRLHDAIWPELVKELEASGIRNMTIFEHDPVLFLYSEIPDEDIRRAHVEPVRDVSARLAEELRRVGKDVPIAVLPEGPMTIPYLKR